MWMTKWMENLAESKQNLLTTVNNNILSEGNISPAWATAFKHMTRFCKILTRFIHGSISWELHLQKQTYENNFCKWLFYLWLDATETKHHFIHSRQINNPPIHLWRWTWHTGSVAKLGSRLNLDLCFLRTNGILKYWHTVIFIVWCPDALWGFQPNQRGKDTRRRKWQY